MLYFGRDRNLISAKIPTCRCVRSLKLMNGIDRWQVNPDDVRDTVTDLLNILVVKLFLSQIVQRFPFRYIKVMDNDIVEQS